MDADLEEELEHHRALKRAELARAGVAPDAIEVATSRALGNSLLARDRSRDVWIWPSVFDALHDGRFAVRLLARERAFTIGVVVALGLAIGANTAIFSIVNAVVVRSLPFEAPDRVVSIGTAERNGPPVRGPGDYRGLSYSEYIAWRAGAREFVSVGAYSDEPMNLADDVAAPDHLDGAYVSANVFALLGRVPILGRDFESADDRPGAASVAILAERLWARRYGRNPNVIGRVVRINGISSTIIGVLGADCLFPEHADLWRPLAQMPHLFGQAGDDRVLSAVGRLRGRATMSAAEAALNATAARVAVGQSAGHTEVRVTPFATRYIAPEIERIVLALMAAVGCVLVIACANVAGLLLARSTARGRELAIRVSLGASRRRIVRQLLAESSLLAALAGTVGLGLAVLGVRLFSRAVTQFDAPPYWIRFNVDIHALAFLVVVCVGSAVLFGLAPALQISRRPVSDVLKKGGRPGQGGYRAGRWAGGLVAIELALTLVLLTAASSMVRSFLVLYAPDRGLDTAHVTSLRLDLPGDKYATPERQLTFYDQLESRLDATGALRATIASRVPLFGGRPRALEIDGRARARDESPIRAPVLAVGRRYFDVLGVRLLRGRAFDEADGEPGHETVIVNQDFATRVFPNADPIGQRLRVEATTGDAAPAAWATIVGVSPTVPRGQEPAPLVYLPYRAEPGASATLLARPDDRPASLLARVQAEVRAVDPDVPLWEVRTLDQWIAFLSWPQRVFGALFAMFAGIALVLSAVGTYAVTTHAVAQRTHEIGVRLALGAQPAQVRWLVLRRLAIQMGFGLALGVPGALAAGRLPFMEPATLATLAPMASLIVAIAMMATLAPTRRATTTDPVATLRLE